MNQAVPDAKLAINNQQADKRDYNVSFAKARKILGFAPLMTIKDSVKEIKDAIISRKIKDYKEKRYSNYSWFKDR